jgi:hypothetical protein
MTTMKKLAAVLVAVAAVTVTPAAANNPPMDAYCDNTWRIIPPQGGALNDPVGGIVAIRGQDNAVWITDMWVVQTDTFYWENDWSPRGGTTYERPKVSYYTLNGQAIPRIVVVGTDGRTYQNRYDTINWVGWTGWQLWGNGRSLYDSLPFTTSFTGTPNTFGEEFLSVSSYLGAPIYRCN